VSVDTTDPGRIHMALRYGTPPIQHQTWLSGEDWDLLAEAPDPPAHLTALRASMQASQGG
jgi:hypothetical protein